MDGKQNSTVITQKAIEKLKEIQASISIVEGSIKKLMLELDELYDQEKILKDILAAMYKSYCRKRNIKF